MAEKNEIPVVLVGDVCVGKSCLYAGYRRDTWTTINASSIIRNITFGEKTIKLQIWDTPGVERSRSYLRLHYRRAHAVMVIYDVTNYESFQHVNSWLEDIDSSAKEGCIRLLVGNKTDLTDERVVTTEEGKAFAKQHGLLFIETSAKNGSNVNEIFVYLASRIVGAEFDKPLYNAAKSGNLNALIDSIAKGADINFSDRSSSDNTPLIIASFENNISVIKLLCEKKADVNAKNKHGMTPLMCAAFSGSIEICQELIKNGAALSTKDNRGKTALVHAQEKKRNEIVSLLATNAIESISNLLSQLDDARKALDEKNIIINRLEQENRNIQIENLKYLTKAEDVERKLEEKTNEIPSNAVRMESEKWRKENLK